MKPPRLSVILATPPGFNPGMSATELALVAFLRRHDLAQDAQCYQLLPFAERLASAAPEVLLSVEQRADTGLHCLPAMDHAGAIAASDAVVFWADFLHMGVYLRELEPIVARALSARGIDLDAGQWLKNVLLLANADDAALGRAISFGTTLLFNTMRDEADRAYAAPLRRFLTRAKRVWVRDALSAAKVAHLRNDFETSAFGVDCALLLTREDVLREAESRGIAATAEPGAILVYAGREPDAAGALAGVARDLGAALRRPVRWLPWGDERAFPLAEPPPASFAASDALDIRALLLEVAHASLVVTDTYHLALIAWNLGVPAVSAFTGHVRHDDDVSSGAEFGWRDKREVFFSQYDALDFLIRPEELLQRTLLERRTLRLAQVATDAPLCTAITARIRAHAEIVEAALARDLKALLQPIPVVASPLARGSTTYRSFTAVAVMCVANEEIHIESALRDLIGEGLDIVLIDHDSTDRTVALARPFLGHGLLSIDRLPWTGSFSIEEQLAAKWRVIDQVDHDWIVHVDADEWLSGPVEGQTLLEALRGVDADGYNAVHFNEFVFVPQRGEDLYAPDYRRRMTRYYLFRPQYPYLLRAWKHRSGLDNRRFAGHLLAGPVRQAPDDFPLRHYIALSEEHARRKYVGRDFAQAELARGYHYDRVGLAPGDLRFPSDDDPRVRTLSSWRSKQFDTAHVATEHFWQWCAPAHASREAPQRASAP